MKAVALLALRFCTGLYLIVWGAVKFVHPERSIEISNRFYGGEFDNPVVQLALGVVAGVIGIFVILGFLRGFSYSVQALVLGVSAAAVGKALFQPLISNFDVVLFIDASTGFIPSFAIFIASLLPLIFWREDFVALDLDEIGDVEKRKMQAEKAAPVVAAAAAASEVHEEAASEPVAEAPVEEVHAAAVETSHDEPSHVEPEPEPDHQPETVAEATVAEAPAAEAPAIEVAPAVAPVEEMSSHAEQAEEAQAEAGVLAAQAAQAVEHREAHAVTH